MPSDLAKDRLVTHAITNYLLASYQGRFASLNLLSQLEHPSFSEEEVVKTQQALGKVTAWNTQLFEDECLFSASWDTAETFEAQNALALLEALKPELYQITAELMRILTLPEVPQKDEIVYLIAHHARNSYSKDTYVRGFMAYGERFALKDFKAKYDTMLAESEFEVRRTTELVQAWREARQDIQKSASIFLPLLFQSTVPLPATFRSHIHDINQLLSQFRGGLTFHNAEFTKAEAELWKKVGLGPGPAGYWRAYNMSPDEARAWLDLNVGEPVLAVEWKKGGFSPETAAPWIAAQIDPFTAFRWHSQGYRPDRAQELIAKGYAEPPPKE